MAKTAAEGFKVFLDSLTPTAAERSATASHGATVLAKLQEKNTIYRIFESGSFSHGTGVRSHSDVDYFLSLNQSRPEHSNSILTSIRSTLIARFPTTHIHASKPAVVLEFGSGYERVEVIPAYPNEKSNGTDMRYRIPAVGDSEWMWSTPHAHSAYVSAVNTKSGITSGAKRLARMAKSWKYARTVPISSFYLEMRAAAYMDTQTSVSWPYDIASFFRSLWTHQLAAMNDPTGNTGRIEPCSSDVNKTAALSRLSRAVVRAEKARNCYKEGKISEAFAQWNLLWNGKFPSYY